MFTTFCFPLRLILWPFGISVATPVSIVPNLQPSSLRPRALVNLVLSRCFPTNFLLSLVSHAFLSSDVPLFRSFLLAFAYLHVFFAHSVRSASLRSFHFWAEILYIHLRLRPFFLRISVTFVIQTDHSLPDTSIFSTVGPGTSSKSHFISWLALRGFQRSCFGIFSAFTHHISLLFSLIVRRQIWNYTNLVFKTICTFRSIVP